MALTGGQTNSSASTRRIRRVRRVDVGRAPFVPHGLLPLLGLLAVLLFGILPFANGVIQTSAERAARQALSAQSASWANIDVSGQRVRLTGSPPSTDAARRAADAVRDARAATLFGQFRPVTRVIEDFNAPSALTPPAGTSPLATPADAAAAPHVLDWAFRLSDGELRLNGEVPDEDARVAILQIAADSRDPPRITTVTDDLIVANTTNPEGADDVSLRAIRALTRCDSGEARYQDARFSFFCELARPDALNVEAMVRQPLPYGEFGDIQVLPREAVASCERSLSDLLNDARIEFATSSAAISSNSQLLLDEVATAVRACPGRLRIEGHTDNTGSAAFNARLSQNRAESVREALITRGVPSNRLVARGFGSSQPIATNTNAAGRARNRRIEIKVERSTQ